MLKGMTIFIILILLLNGCTSSSELRKSSANHKKAGKYYEAIGQPNAANEERQLAERDRKKSLKAPAIIQEIVNSKKR